MRATICRNSGRVKSLIGFGGGPFIHAWQTGKRVSIASRDDGWYAENWVGARRL
jgi:hypothetical protein